MEYALCGEGSCCPQLNIKGKKVTIGEEGNVVSLNAGQWNDLVKLIKSGKVGKV